MFRETVSRHWYGELLGRLSLATCFVIPFLIDEGGWEFSYSVHYRDKAPQDLQVRYYGETILLGHVASRLLDERLQLRPR